MFSKISELIQGADLAICHLETPISADNKELSGYPIFNAPKELANDLASVGYNGCSTASNHSLDKGSKGVFSTLDQLEAAGLKWAGMARNMQEKQIPTFYLVNEIVIAHLSYTYGLNGFRIPSKLPFLVDVIEISWNFDDMHGTPWNSIWNPCNSSMKLQNYGIPWFP